MREIKFRAWEKFYKKMIYGWRALTDQSNKQHVVVDRVDGVPGQNFVQGILMQFTGFYDNAENEIYEGDIVEWSIYEDAQDTEDGKEAEVRIKDSVVFSNGCFATKNRRELLFSCAVPHRNLQVIGNIYENPELCATKS
jgi:uncharacterized phage protein (TIGR01671 family)